MKPVHCESFAVQRHVLQHELQQSRRTLSAELGLSETPATHFPRSTTMAVLTGQPGLNIFASLAQKQLQERFPYVLAVTQCMRMVLFK
ncbi:MAG: hypothetical protein GW763_09300 [Paraglaciecola sp.]|nr:hypothetical protein [Paraglaciecola sp.]